MEKIKKSPSHSMEEFTETLRKNGLKVTSQRVAVHKAMMELGHASADMVLDRIRKDSSVKVTVASVYNILSQLADLGIYQYRLSNNNKMYFDVNTFKHMHLYDTRNHEFMDIIDGELYKMIEEKLLKHRYRGYKIDSLDIQVLCHPTGRRSKTKAKA